MQHAFLFVYIPVYIHAWRHVWMDKYLDAMINTFVPGVAGLIILSFSLSHALSMCPQGCFKKGFPAGRQQNWKGGWWLLFRISRKSQEATRVISGIDAAVGLHQTVGQMFANPPF